MPNHGAPGSASVPRSVPDAGRARGRERIVSRLWVPARISHHLPAADADRPASTALNVARGLDVPSSTPARPDSRSPCRSRPLRALASRSGEKSGLAAGLCMSLGGPIIRLADDIGEWQFLFYRWLGAALLLAGYFWLTGRSVPGPPAAGGGSMGVRPICEIS